MRWLLVTLVLSGCGEVGVGTQEQGVLGIGGGGGGGGDGCTVTCPAPTPCGSWQLDYDTCECNAVLAPAGTACSDYNQCTVGDHCDGAGACVTTPAYAGYPCNDGNACTTNDFCDASGVCGGTYTACAPPTFTWFIDYPNVAQPVTDYSSYRFKPGDVVIVQAGGCVQTGGTGLTWKRYVNPSGDNADRLYHGRIWIPGATMGLETIGSVINRSGLTGVTVAMPEDGYDPAQMFLRLGYDDDDYSNNGYWSPDPGTENQCAGEQHAWVQLTVKRYGGRGQPRSCPSGIPIEQFTHHYADLFWDALDPNGLPKNPILGHRCYPGTVPITVPADCGVDLFDDAQRWIGSCTNFLPTTDTKDMFDTPIGQLCGSDSSDVNGHLNLGFATFTGTVYWVDWEKKPGIIGADEAFDDDYNIAMVPDTGDQALTIASDLVPARSTVDDNKPALLLEMTASDTVHHGDFYDSTGAFHLGGYRPGAWNTLAYGTDQDKISALLSSIRQQDGSVLWVGKRAVALGLVGFDMVHSGKTELHPLLGLAVQTQAPDPSNGNQEVWIVMVRRAGNEGECSHDNVAATHGFSMPFMRFSLPTKNKVPASVQFFDGFAPVTAWASQPWSDGPTILTVSNPPEGHVVLGEIRFTR